jgi:predicted dinucleotide-binding enzyme
LKLSYFVNFSREFIESVGAHLTTVEDAVVGSDLVVVAIPKDFYVSLPVDLLSGKVVIDVSNRNSVHRKMEM